VDDRPPIGKLLVERGVARSADVEEAALSARSGHSRLCSKLLESGVCEEGELVEVLAERHGLPGVDVSHSVLDLAAMASVPRAVAEADLLLPLSLEGGRLHLAVASPEAADRLVPEVRFITGREVSLYVVVLHALRQALEACYQACAEGKAVWRGAAVPPKASAVSLAVRLPKPRPAASQPLPPPGAEVAAPPAAPASSVRPPAAAPSEEVVLSVAVRPANARRVLVVDDEPAIQNLVKLALEKHGYGVEVASDGAEALEKARRVKPHLVLLDAMLPKVHGFEVARRLRADETTRTLPIIMMTAVYRGWRFAQDARETCGAQDYVEKPFRVEDLLQRVEAVLKSKQVPPTAAAAAPHIAAGRAALVAGQVAEALAAFEEAVKADAFSADAYHGLGEALRARGEQFQAMSAYERAVELRPGLLAALRTLAALYLEKGFRSKAAEVMERAIHVAKDAPTRELIRRQLLALL
jgi:DNA-binding response OmpR family regulator